MKFLVYLDLPWAKKIEHPQTVHYTPVRVPEDHLFSTAAIFKSDLQMTSLIHLGCDSGLRAEELYQLRLEDIDLENRIVYVRCDENHTVKNKGSIRISFFTNRTARILQKYFTEFKRQNRKRNLWNEITIEKKFRQAPIRCKLLRKVFSSRWEKNLGPSGAKAALMGHANKTVDTSHYLSLSDNELREIYDRVMK